MRRLEDDQKVFGLGLSKTGTSSLTEALKILGIPTLHYPNDPRTVEQLKRGDYRLAILDRFQGLTDTPVAPFYAQLDKAWPGSKFILTVREKSSWLRSAESHWRILKATGRMANNERFQAFADFVSACVYGCIYFNAERFSFAYDLHVRNVREYFADRPDDFLMLDICGGGDLWPQLSEFVGRPVPPGAAFPHAYKSSWPDGRLMRQELKRVHGPGQMVLIDFQGLREFAAGQMKVRPLIGGPGRDRGVPATDAQAIEALERLRRTDVTTLAISSSTWWFLDRFPEFAAHVRERYPVLLSDERLLVFDLREGSGNVPEQVSCD